MLSRNASREERERPVAHHHELTATVIRLDVDRPVAQARVDVAGEAVARLVVVVVGVGEEVVELHFGSPPLGA